VFPAYPEEIDDIPVEVVYRLILRRVLIEKYRPAPKERLKIKFVCRHFPDDPLDEGPF
jgi:hypothetical protein